MNKPPAKLQENRKLKIQEIIQMKKKLLVAHSSKTPSNKLNYQLKHECNNAKYTVWMHSHVCITTSFQRKITNGHHKLESCDSLCSPLLPVLTMGHKKSIVLWQWLEIITYFAMVFCTISYLLFYTHFFSSSNVFREPEKIKNMLKNICKYFFSTTCVYFFILQ